MVIRPSAFNSYEYVVIASLRAKQLLSGCVPRVEGEHSAATMAQMEVAGGKVGRASADEPEPGRQCLWQL
jgi:DNA-directed RNA polymerase subunit K/omega